MLKKTDILKQIKDNLADGDELIGYFYAKINPNLLVMYMTGAFAGLMFEPFIVAITKKGLFLYRVNKLGTKFLDYYFFDFVNMESVEFGWGIIERSMKITLKGGNFIKMMTMAIGGEGTKLTSELKNYIQNMINNK